MPASEADGPPRPKPHSFAPLGGSSPKAEPSAVIHVVFSATSLHRPASLRINALRYCTMRRTRYSTSSALSAGWEERLKFPRLSVAGFMLRIS